jgi:WD40 repeat protein
LLFQLIDNDERLVALGSKTAWTWDVKKGARLTSVPHEAGADSFRNGRLLSPDGRMLAVVDSERVGFRKEKALVPADVYDLRSGKLSAKLTAESMSIRSAVWSPDSKTLLTLSDWFSDKRTEMCFWDSETLAKRACFIKQGGLSWQVFSKDGKRFYGGFEVPGAQDGGAWLSIRDTKNGAVIYKIKLDKARYLFDSLFLSPSEIFLAQELVARR